MLVENLPSCNDKEPEKPRNGLEIPNNATDQGYQSEETRSISPGKAPDATDAVFSNVSPTTEDSSKTCDPVIQSSEGNDGAFVHVTGNKVTEETTASKIDIKSDHTLCHHSSRCHQCVLGMLWKNRIRRNDGIYVDADERSSLRNKLRSVFKGELFNTVYQALILNWEGNELEFLRVSSESLLNSLNYDQTQHLPLMMQLIQLDLLKKSNSVCT
ncbi:uncharacterized protein LOC118194996 [Stegodyphus dumicola]|uniref:uncharacterized protein LOC118194996 n=1 Tax=Stegodyphus dumicola TaxID=202533 RepID=UPI0015AC8BBB|nr:uncharacterized protein LOC118194996 [Stegodyphus dumicola]